MEAFPKEVLSDQLKWRRYQQKIRVARPTDGVGGGAAMLLTLLVLPAVWAAGGRPPAADHPGLPAPPVRSVPGRLGDDGLVRWGNGHLEVARSPFLLGEKLVVAGTWLEGETSWSNCSWETPSGEVSVMSR
jgi:hypothetical protein